jgi:F-type H+-transporting ATPase subunit epsilon
MFARAVRRFHALPALRLRSGETLRAAAAEEAAAASNTELTLNVAAPEGALVKGKVVKRVTLPGRGGVFGIEKNSPAMLSELRPGVIRVDHADGAAEEFFVPGGFAFKHKRNHMDVSCPEAAKLDQIDVDALRAANAQMTKAKDAAAAGSKEFVEASLALEVYKSLGQALKVTL